MAAQHTASTLTPLEPVFRAVVRTVVPNSAGLDERGWRELEALVNESLLGRPKTLRRRLRLFVRLVQWLPVFRYALTFTSLDNRRRTAFLTSLQRSRIRLVRVGFWGLRTLAFLGYYGRIGAAEAIGYRPDPRGWQAER